MKQFAGSKLGPVVIGLVTVLAGIASGQRDMLWLRSVTGSGDGRDRIQAVAADAQGNVYGAIEGRSGEQGRWRSCVTTVKYSATGELLWWRRLTRPNGVLPAAIALDRTGNVFVTGTADTLGPQANILTLKYSGSGDSCWVVEYDATGRADVASAINLDAQGNAYVSGSSIATGGSWDGVLLKYTNSGQLEWAQVFDRTQRRDSVCSAVLDSSGCIYQVGFSGNEYLVLKYRLDGGLDWSRTYRTVGTYLLYDCALAPTGDLLACGSSRPRWDTSGILTTKYSSGGDRLWVQEIRAYDEGDWWNYGYSIGADDLGNAYVAGSRCVDGADTWRVAVVKYTSSGTELWRRYCSRVWVEGDRRRIPMVVSGSGETYVTATGDAIEKRSPAGETLWTRGWPSLDETSGLALALTPGGVCVGGVVSVPDDSDILLDFLSDGTELWRARLNNSPGPSSDCAIDVTFDPWGNLVAVGVSQETGQYDEIVAVKFSPTGEPLWTRTYHQQPGVWIDRAHQVKVDASGNSYVVGQTQTESTGYDYTILKYDPDGNLLWARHYNGPGNGEDVPADFALDRFGNVIVTGRSFGGHTGMDCATVKYSPSGQELWVRRCCGSGDSLGDEGTAIAVDAAGATFVAVYTLYVDTLPHWPGLVIKYDAAGDTVWQTRVFTPLINRSIGFRSIELDSAGRIYLAGGGTGYELVDSDAFLLAAKLHPAGETAWVRSVPLTAGGGWADGRVSSGGRFYVTGTDAGRDSCYTLAYSRDGDLLWRSVVTASNAFVVRSSLASNGILYVVSGRYVGYDRVYRVLAYDSLGRVCWGDSFPPDSAGIAAVVADESGQVAICGSVSRHYDLFAALFAPRLALDESSCNESKREALHLALQPNPFQDKMHFHLCVPPRSSVSLRVYDRTGRLVRTLLEGTTNLTAISSDWDGADAAGRSVTAGVYLVQVEAMPRSPEATRMGTRTMAKIVKLE